jgi:hypothetical protein
MVPSSGFKYFISNTSYEAPLYSWLASSIFKTAELKELAYMTDVNPPANLLFATVTYLLEASPDDPFSGLVFRAASDREFDHDRCEAEFVAFCGRHWDIIKNYVNTRNFQLRDEYQCSRLTIRIINGRNSRWWHLADCSVVRNQAIWMV